MLCKAKAGFSHDFLIHKWHQRGGGAGQSGGNAEQSNSKIQLRIATEEITGDLAGGYKNLEKERGDL